MPPTAFSPSQMPRPEDQTEAHFYLGRVAFATNDFDKAFTEFSVVSKASSGAPALKRLPHR